MSASQPTQPSAGALIEGRFRVESCRSTGSMPMSASAFHSPKAARPNSKMLQIATTRRVMIGTLNESNCIGRGKGFFEPDFQRFLKTVAFDVMVVITLEHGVVAIVSLSLEDHLERSRVGGVPEGLVGV